MFCGLRRAGEFKRAPVSMPDRSGRFRYAQGATVQYSRFSVMDLEYIPGGSDWKLAAKTFPYNVTI